MDVMPEVCTRVCALVQGEKAVSPGLAWPSRAGTDVWHCQWLWPTLAMVYRVLSWEKRMRETVRGLQGATAQKAYTWLPTGFPECPGHWRCQTRRWHSSGP